MKKRLFGSLADGIKGNAILIILSICVVAAGALSFYTVNDINNKLKNQQVKKSPQSSTTQSEERTQNVQNEGEKVPLKPSPTPNASPTPVPTATPTTSSVPPEEREGFMLPVSGEIYNAFSRDELVYNKSMDDWRTHNGVDIKASRDSAVKAGAGGIVTAVYTDGMLGVVVEVKTDEYIARYCGLNANTIAKKGDSVAQGDPLGTVGEVTLEITDEPHLHLEIVKKGINIDPAEIIK